MRDALLMDNCYLRIESGRDIIPPSQTSRGKLIIQIKYDVEITS